MPSELIRYALHAYGLGGYYLKYPYYLGYELYVMSFEPGLVYLQPMHLERGL